MADFHAIVVRQHYGTRKSLFKVIVHIKEQWPSHKRWLVRDQLAGYLVFNNTQRPH